MATVTGMTAAAMMAIRDETIVSAAFDSTNHLILTKYDGSTVDAGVVQDSSVTAKGLVELATTAETTTGTDTVRAVTPSGLAAVKALLLSLTGGSMSGTINSVLAAAGNVALAAIVAGDTFDRYRAYADGKQEWGSGALARDTNWYRSAAGILKTDTAMLVGTSLGVGTDLSVTGNINSAANQNMGAWTSYTPTWTGNTTNPAIGNGTIVGRYQRVGRGIHFGITITAGSTTTYGSGGYNFGLPVASANTGVSMIGNCEILLAQRWAGAVVISPSATTASVWLSGGTSTANLSQFDASTPTTMASGHIARISGYYEAAS